MRVVALIPAFQESQRITEVVRGILPHVVHVLVVDDGSTDGTSARAQAAGAEVIGILRNRGKGNALRTGLVHALARDYTHVLFMDADMQHLPDEAAGLLEAAKRSGADIVIGERQFKRDEMPASRYYANRIGSWALSKLVGLPISDTQCGFRVCRADILRSIALSATGYDIETEMLIKIRRRGGRVQTVPVTAVYGDQPSKLRPIPDTTRTCFLAMYYRFLERP